MCTAPRKIILGLRYIEANPLSPIPEIAGSAYVSPEISPEPVLEPTSKSAKFFSPNEKILKKREINIRIQKKLTKLNKTKNKKESIISIKDIDSHAVYLKNNQEKLKVMPLPKEKKSFKIKFLSKSPQRPEITQLVRGKSSKRETLPKYLNNNIISLTDRESNAYQRLSEGPNNNKSKLGNKNISDIIEKYSKTRGLVNSKLNKITELASEEIKMITKTMINR